MLASVLKPFFGMLVHSFSRSNTASYPSLNTQLPALDLILDIFFLENVVQKVGYRSVTCLKVRLCSSLYHFTTSVK